MPPSRGGPIVRRIAPEAFVVEIVAGVAAIWALGLLSLYFSLPAEFVAPADAIADAANELEKTQPQSAA